MPSASLTWILDPTPSIPPVVIPAEEIHVTVPSQLKGYILEPPRVGGSNSPFTFTPNVLISDQGTFDAAYPLDESAPRSEYMVQVLREVTGSGTGPGGIPSLPDATFAWTKNEGAVQSGLQVPFQRFDYAGQDQVFKPLQGAPRELLGVLAVDANTSRLEVASVPLLEDLSSFPVRLSVGSTGSGTTLFVTLVSSFGVPAPGVVEMDATGALNWSASDISAHLGTPVYFQRQTFYLPNETTGIIGTLGTELLLLNPLPTTGQKPAIKIGSRNYLVPVERATEGAFSADPAEVEWALDTGRLKFNGAVVTALSGQPVIYDGVFIAWFQVPVASVGPAQSMPCGTLATLPSESSDVYFRIVKTSPDSETVQFSETAFVDTFESVGRKGQVQIRRSDRAVQLSAADRAEHTGRTVQVVLPDVLIEHGISLRLFRSLINPDGTIPTARDVTAFYTREGATLANPIIAQPFVFLPALPREDVTLTVNVNQGTGSFVGELARLDVVAPPEGKGYVLDFQTRQLSYAERKVDEILPVSPFDFSVVQLPNAPAHAMGLVIELEEENSENFITRVENRDFTIDLGSGVITYVQTEGALVLAGTATLSGSTLVVSEDLIAAAVEEGDSLLVSSGPLAGLYSVVGISSSTTATVSPNFPSVGSGVPYEIHRSKEILTDRFFRSVPPVDPNTRVERVNALGTIANGPRLSINPALASRVRFRFGRTSFSTSVVLSSKDPDTGIVAPFTAPGSLASGTVEVNPITGEVNFSQADLTGGGIVYWSLSLQLGSEYSLQPALGFIEFADRMLEREEILLHYMVFDTDGLTKILVQERASFLVPKELVQVHPAPVSTLSFNPTGREVALTPAPSAFRGGRPQSPARVTFNVSHSTVTFLPDSQITDALAHGSTVDPSENVYVDYHVHEALGGESNLVVSRGPMATVQVEILSENADGTPRTWFEIEGDRTSDFQEGLLELDGAEVYLILGSMFDGITTTVLLDQTTPQYFRSDLRNPTLHVTSGVIRRFAAGALPSYFTLEDVPFDAIARGSTRIRLLGDQARHYSAGTVVVLTDSLTFQEYYLVEGALYASDLDRTTIVLTSGVVRQYASPMTLLRSVRPVSRNSSVKVTTNNSPLLVSPYTVYRQVEGQVGQILRPAIDYTIDDSGAMTFVDGLALNEELGIFYTGVEVIKAGRRTRASWTFSIVPTVDNGLVNQVLKMDYTTYSPDTFFFRVETLTNFRAELVEQFSDSARAASPSQGPVLENAGSTRLFEKGNPSLFFEEGDLANQDLVARHTLVFFNNVINDLESYFQSWAGPVIGDHDGRFLFDGNIDNPVRTAFAHATNQIDDLIQVFGSTPRRAFEAANYSRFYPTQKLEFGVAGDPTTLFTGDPILDLHEKALKAVVSVRNRSPWAVTTVAAPAGSTVFEVDHAQGAPELLRPGLDVAPGLKVVFTTREGTVLVAEGTPSTIALTTATSVTLTAPVAVAVPKGSTIRMAALDDAFKQSYALGIDVGVDLDGGFLTHVSNDDIPVFFAPNASPEAGVPLDVVLQMGATSSEPFRFPALDGGTSDDDGNRQFPAFGIDAGAEQESIQDELALIDSVTGDLTAIVSPSLQSAGNLTSSSTLDRGFWPVPIPKVGDLVRILTGGVGGASFYHRVMAVGASSVTVEPSFESSSGGVTFEVTTGVPLTSIRTATLATTTVLFDFGGNFTAHGIKPGHTVVATAGTYSGQRRQVLEVTSSIFITVAEPFTGTGAITYQIVDSLATFGGVVGSLQESWVTTLSEQLRALEGQDFIDFSERIVVEVAAHTATVSAIDMGAYSSLLVFVAVDTTSGSGSIDVSSVTFNGTTLTTLSSTPDAVAGGFGLHAYLASDVSGLNGDLVVTAVATAPSMKIFALKLSKVKSTFNATTVGVASATVGPTTLGATGLVSVEAGDLVVSFAANATANNDLYPMSGHDTLIPRFNSAGISALLTATRATAARQPVTSQFRMVGISTRTRVVTIVLTKDSGADTVSGRALSEKAALEHFFDDVSPDRGLGTLTGNIASSTTITGDFTNVAKEDVLFIRHGPNAGVYTIDTATSTSATVVEPFSAPPETSVGFKVGSVALVPGDALSDAFIALRNVEAAIVSAGRLLLLHHCPILVYRNGVSSGGLPGTSDSSFTESGGRLVLGGAYARGISSLTVREAALDLRSATTDQGNLEDILASGHLYDRRFTWIDERINLETGILARQSRAVENRQKAQEKIVASLTKLLTL